MDSEDIEWVICFKVKLFFEGLIRNFLIVMKDDILDNWLFYNFECDDYVCVGVLCVGVYIVEVFYVIDFVCVGLYEICIVVMIRVCF